MDGCLAGMACSNLRRLLLVQLALGCSAALPLNASAYKLQLPVSNGKGGIVEIQPSALPTYISAYFTPGDDGSVALFCPVGGAHTSGSKYPRTELRELLEWKASAADGAHAHTLEADMAVTRAPPSGKLVVGQVHVDGLVGACSVVLELEWEAGGTVEARLRDKACKTVSKNVGYGIELNRRFRYSVKVGVPPAGMHSTSFNASTDGAQSAPTLNVTLTWQTSKGQTVSKSTGAYALVQPLDDPLYFKAGAYLQDSSFSSNAGGVSSTDGATVSIHALRTTHA